MGNQFTCRIQFSLLSASLVVGCSQTHSDDEYVDFRQTTLVASANGDATPAKPIGDPPVGVPLSSESSVALPSVPAKATLVTATSHEVTRPDPSSGGVDVEVVRSEDAVAKLESTVANAPLATPGGDASSSDGAAAGTVVSGALLVNPGADAAGSESAAEITGSRTLSLKELQARAVLDPSADIPLEARTMQLLIPHKTFRKERNSATLRVSYDDIDLLKILNMEPVPVDAANHFPDWLKKLDGTVIRIRGFMYPTFDPDGLTIFTLARDNGICCFVRKPKIYDIISVELAAGVTSHYIEGRPFDVEGTFRILPEADETELYQLYKIENARIVR